MQKLICINCGEPLFKKDRQEHEFVCYMCGAVVTEKELDEYNSDDYYDTSTQ